MVEQAQAYSMSKSENAKLQQLVNFLATRAHPIWMKRDTAALDYAPILSRIGASNGRSSQQGQMAKWVLIGDGTHGSGAFFDERAKITQQLLDQGGFSALAIEWDWPDVRELDKCLRPSSAVRTKSGSRSAASAAFGTLGTATSNSRRGVRDADGGTAAAAVSDELRTRFGGRFPDFMWRTREFERFLQWAARHNADLRNHGRHHQQMQLYGLDMYSMMPSAEHLFADLETSDLKSDQSDLSRLRSSLACLTEGSHSALDDDSKRNPPISGECAEQVEKSLRTFLRQGPKRYAYDGHENKDDDDRDRDRDDDGQRTARAGGRPEDDEFFNALVVADMANYTRPDLDRSEAWHWNKREEHMADVLDWLAKSVCPPSARFVVWAHNSHCWDASATSQSDTDPEPTLSLGQVMRERHPGQTVHIGFLTYAGTVTGADDWGAPIKTKEVLPAQPGSYEYLLHCVAQRLGSPALYLDLQEPSVKRALQELAPWQEERAIGAVYHPEIPEEHHLEADLSRQFDMIVFVDRTLASHVLRGL